MGAAAEVFIKISADAKSLTAGFDKAADAVKAMGKEVEKSTDSIQQGAAQSGAAVKKLGDTLQGVQQQGRGAAAALGEVGNATGKLGQTESVFKGVFAGSLAAELASDAFRFLTGQVTEAAAALARIDSLNAQTAQTLATTGNAANTSTQAIINYSGALERTTGIEAETIQQGQNMLLTFTNIRNGVGASNQIFDRASKAMVDMSVAMGVSVKSAAAQLGKALNDPVVGLSALQRAGVTFSGGQKELVAAMVASGNVMGAQKFILAELERQVGGSADAFGKTLPGAFARAGHALTSLTEAMMIPSIPYVTNGLGMIAEAAFDLAAALTGGGGVFSAINQALGPGAIAMVVGLAGAMHSVLIPAAVATAAAFARAAIAAAPIIAAAAGIAFAAYPIIKNWDGVVFIFQWFGEKGAAAFRFLRDTAAWVFSEIAAIVGKAMGAANRILRDTFGVDISEKLGIGLGIASKAVVSFGRSVTGAAAPAMDALKGVGSWVGDQFTATWGDAMESARNAYTQFTTVTQDETKKLSAAAEQGAYNVTQAAQKKQKAVKKTAEVFSAAFSIMSRAFNQFVQQSKASAQLGQELAAIDAKVAEMGREFDAAPAKLAAYEKSLDAITAAYGRNSKQAEMVEINIALLKAQATPAAAALAKAYAVIGAGTRDVEQQQKIAAALGREFDLLGAQVAAAENSLTELIKMGLNPGNAAYDEAAEKLRELRNQMKKAVDESRSLRENLQDVAGGLSGLGGSLSRLGFDQIGEIASKIGDISSAAIGLVVAFEQIGKIGLVFAQLGKIIGGVVAAVVGIGAAFLALPLGVVIGIIVAVGVAIAAIAWHWEPIKESLIAGWNWISEQVSRAVFAVRTFLGINTELEEQQKRAAEEQEKMAAVALKNNPAFLAFMEKQAQSAERIKLAYEGTTKLIESLKKTTVDAITVATYEMMLGIDGWAENLELKLKEAMFQGLMDKMIFEQVTEGLKEEFDAIGDAVMQGQNDQAVRLAAQLSTKVKGMIGPLAEAGKELLKGLGLVGSDAEKVLQGAYDKAAGLTRSAKAGADAGSRAAVERYLRAQMDAMDMYRNMGKGPGTYEYEVARDQAEAAARQLREMATGGLVTGPTAALIGEGQYKEAVLPLNDRVFSQLAAGITEQQRAPGAHVTVHVNYTGNGKWTREDAQGLGRLMVAELRAMGVRA